MIVQEANDSGRYSELTRYEENRAVPINDHTYKVYTYEEYETAYASGSQEISGYNSEYIVIHMEDGSLALNKTVKAEKVFSENVGE